MAVIPAIRVRQWLDEWDLVPTDESEFQSPPPREFYLTSMRASDLRALADVHQRDAGGGTPRAEDPYVQRTLETERTAEIQRYIRVGYPLSSMGARRMPEEERASLRKPGWLPTAIIANIIPAGEFRAGSAVEVGDAMSVEVDGDRSAVTSITLPDTWTDTGWMPSGASPIEIIDGQHRLSAFSEDDDDFELPVVFFSGLGFSWQAYLFWTVNIKPKRINASLAYDLYPLLRDQKWLEAGESLNVYRETRAQELVEALWGDPRSVWFDRINMLGQSGMRSQRPVTQAAFVRSLTHSLVRPFKGHHGLGGLFGGAADNTGFQWPRGQQSAFLIFAWNALGTAINANESLPWAERLRSSDDGSPLLVHPEDPRQDPAIVGDRSLLASDQGVRSFHMVLNDLAYLDRDNLRLGQWTVSGDVDSNTTSQIDEAYATLESNDIGNFLYRLAEVLASYDWRNSRAPELDADQKQAKQALRGSGGYNILRESLLRHVAFNDDPELAALAQQALEARGA